MKPVNTWIPHHYREHLREVDVVNDGYYGTSDRKFHRSESASDRLSRMNRSQEYFSVNEESNSE